MVTVDNRTAIRLATPVQDIVGGLIQQYEALWWSCDADLPDLGPMVTARDKHSRESQLSSSIDHLIAELEHLANSPQDRQQVEDHLVVLMSNFARTAFGVDDRQLSAIFSTGIVDATREFLRQARGFDPSIGFQDVYQASRNAWTMNLLQLFWGLPVAVTPAVLGYSLLYPYTDNLLDDPNIPAGAKVAFNQRFRLRLEGEAITPLNPDEAKIYACVGLIESQYDRWQNPEVYASLLAIYAAQAKSMQLLNPQASPYELDVLGLSFEKGGASVLADGFLVAGRPTPSQCEMAFHYGSFTQLMDDLEDIGEDRERGLMTIFSQTAKRWPLDRVTNRAFQYGLKMLEKMEEFGNAELDALLELLHLAITPLLIDSISQAGRFYTPAYLRKLEAHFPYRFAYLKKQRKRVDKKFHNNHNLLDNLLKTVI